MSEWLKEHAWKACVGETLPWVRIPLSPPAHIPRFFQCFCANHEEHDFLCQVLVVAESLNDSRLLMSDAVVPYASDT
jgi:hypothetical protein